MKVVNGKPEFTGTIDVVKHQVRDIINYGCGDAISIKETIVD